MVTVQPEPSSECPSCGRFVGPYERCPYCGADIGQRMAVRVLKVGSLVLAIGGLAVLMVAALQTEAPKVEIGDLTGTMNWAYVHIEGVVVSQPIFDSPTAGLRFWVWDGTGEMMVTAYRSEAEALLAQGVIPVMGDAVTAEGTLRVRDDFQYLVLDAPHCLEIRPTEPVVVPIAEVDADLLYRRVTVRGLVRDDRVPYDGLRILTLRDATGEIDVALSSRTIALTGAMPDVSLGQSLQVTAAVDQYRGQPQLSVGRGGDLEVSAEVVALATLRRLGDLSTKDVGSMAVVEGVIADVDPFSAGVKYRIDDGSGTVTFLLWQDLYDTMPDRGALVAGTTVRIQGEVAEYQGELEIVPEVPADVTVLVVADRTPAERHLGELGSGDINRLVKVEGVLAGLRAFSAGVRGMLDDGTGTVTLLLWQEVYDALPEPELVVPGAILCVEGEVHEYKGQLEIVPSVPGDVAIAGMVDLPMEERAIGQINDDDMGQVVQLAGEVLEVMPFAQGMQVTLDDGTGIIRLLLWQDLLERLARPDLLAEGVRLSVRGEIAEYQGKLEIVPQVPADVTWMGLVDSTTATPTRDSELDAETGEVPEGPSGLTAPTGATTEAPTEQPVRFPTPSASPVPTPEIRAIGAISSSDVGTLLTLRTAGIADRSFFSRGVQYTLSDGTGSIILLVWQDVVERIPDRYGLVPGCTLRVTGEISEYEGNLEIIIREATDVQLLERAETLPLEERPANHVTAADEGRIFVVEGVVKRTESSAWLKLWLDDGTGEILVFVPERTVPYLPAGIGQGVRLRVTGEVDIYRSALEIIPLAGADVEVR